MKLKITRNVNNNKFETMVEFEEWGGLDIEAEDEKELLANFPCILDYKNVTFSGKFKIENGEVVKADDKDEQCEQVSISLVKKVLPITESFQAKYEVSISQILDEEIKTILNTKELVCQAKVKLFENKISEEIKKLIDITKVKNNNFEKESPISIIL